ncbi:MAG TPA: zinc ribbon domain-containing protein [Elusimicrobia bacterium]|nr:MAG: hypothetical protein A2278_06390 [Elusimicrobia bacterium RIFOXYA12_FULL_49_49]OGS10358.1 MAG: hypothetical protein A2386_04515 [Elusimicrobia bacterium RIFOXYB1_FULL_48_9]OGS16303.1 MAG: hypothetical protein A2251_01705 [Elusimicrobia bacterium RIFOXYA2_FULL_47_53]OGS25847.1 MAG: hypothetical protein A2339_03595 [Elusimicrobia bacterium RIFOXYB12_FULL_50_12]OGS31458.1 MAG: hypothetical protein A2323_09995 [Elusimicrobia bacterium RIFOXYB2_FULL_46_23]HBU70532.1 zinc ribbon domain-conta
MPIFEYKCGKCGHKFEQLTFESESKTVKCPKCSSENTEKQFSQFASGNSKSGQKNFSCPTGGCCPGCNNN